MLSSWATGIAKLIGPGHAFEILDFVPVVPAIGAAVGAIVVGFIWHPVLEWIIDKLQGSSDQRSRTNYFLTTMSIAILTAVPSALGTMLAPVPYLGVVIGPLLSTVAIVVSLYVTYRWFEFFNVVKWFRTAILVLGALAVVGVGLVGLVRGVLSIFSGGGGSAQVATGTGDTEVGDGEVIDETPPTDPEEAKAWAEKRAAAAIAAAQAKAKAATPTEPSEPTEEPAKTPTEPVKPTTTAKAEPKPPPSEPEPVAPPKAKEPPPVVPTPAEPVAPVVANTAYATFARRRDQIEKSFENDPTLLQKNGKLRSLYSNYLRIASEVDAKWAKEAAKHRDQTKLNARLREAELFDRGSKTIELLAEKLKIQ